MNVPFVDLKVQYDDLREEVEAAIRGVLESTRFIGGQPVENFEQEFAAYCEADYAVGVGNGTDALELALQAFDIGAGDEVITQANTFIATAEAIVRRNAIPVFVDINPDTHTIDPDLIEAAITPRTKAIIPVHLYGQPADMAPINDIAERRGLYVIEDAAQAHGATYEGRRVGSLGHAACFSFYPGKNLGAYGDGGAITSNDSKFIQLVLQLRDHGRLTKYEHSVIGTNSRLDTIQAAILSIKLRHLDRWNEQRRQIANSYISQFKGAGLKTPSIRQGSSHVFHLFVVELGDREKIAAALEEKGIATGIHYPIPLHRQRAITSIPFRQHDLQNTERAAGRILSLPIYPELGQAQVDKVVNALLDLKGETQKLQLDMR